MKCDVCQRFLREIAKAELQKDYENSRVFLSLLETHRNTTCKDYKLVRQLWPDVVIVSWSDFFVEDEA